MYLDYWQLTSKPFEPGASRTTFYPCESHEAALLKLRYAVENRRGAVLLAGPSGVGKTSLVQLFGSELRDEFRPQVHVVFPQMSSRDLLVYLAEQLERRPPRIHATQSRKASAGSKPQLRHNVELGQHAVVVVDEAHLLEDCGALETLRLLLNFESAGHRCSHSCSSGR